MCNKFITRLFSLSMLCTVLAFSAHGQQKAKLSEFKNWKPRNIGPAGMSGRVTTIAGVTSEPNSFFVGAASGGVWKTTNGGADWTSVFDDQPLLNIGSIAVQQDHPNVVWVGTGEGNPRNSLNLGNGMFKSIDGGRSWKRAGLEKTSNIHRVLIDPEHPNTVYAGAIGNPYAPHPDRGVFKTIDGGITWNKILYTNDTSGVGDMIMDPTNPQKLIVGMWQHRRTPWSFKSGGPGSGLYMTTDGGANWKKLGKDEGLPEGDFGRIGLAMSKSNPKRIYALVEATKNGLYRSDDGGYTWALINSNEQWVTNRPFYFQDIACDPKNDNKLWLINQMISLSEDGGKDFHVVIPYNGIHPDHHAFWVDPNDGDHIADGNDGGIGITHDGGRTWLFDEKLPVGQFYHINVDDEMPYHVMGGMQDNGSWWGPAYNWVRGGIKNYYWESLWSGDGFDAMPDPDDANWIYAESQGGSVGKYNVKTGQSWYIQPTSPDSKTILRFNWNAAIAQDPFDHSTIYFGSQFLMKSTDKGASWSTISPDLTTNDSLKIDQSKNGGLSLDITGAENHCTIITIAPAFKEKGVIWVGTDDGNVQLTRDGGKTWTNFRGKIPGLPVGAWVPQIQTSHYNGGEAFIVANDYRRGDMKPYIFRTTDYGKTWTRMLDEKKVNGYALCVLQDPTEPNLLFAGTEQGLWVSFDNGGSFEQWKNGYPPVSTYDLAIQNREADLAIATFGRALWILDDIRPLRKIAASTKGLPEASLSVFPSPDAVQAQYRNAPGYEWSTWGVWDATNRPEGAALSYFVKPNLRDTANKKKWTDSVNVKLFNDKGEQIRRLKWKADTGFNRGYWGMEEKGYRRPGSARPKPDAAEPGGDLVLPGVYKAVLEYNGVKDSTLITVKDDPRMGDRIAVRKSQRALQDRLRVSSDKLTESMDRLTEAEDITKKMDSQLKDLEGKDVDSLRKVNKAMQDSIKNIRESINGKKLDGQGYGRIPQVTPMSELGQANNYIDAKPIAPGTQEENLVARAEAAIGKSVQRTNNFFDGAWKNYRQLVESTKLPLFKDYKPIQ